MAYEAIITTIGLAKIADAIANDTPLNLTTMKVGDGEGNPTNPADNDTDLVRVVYSGTPNRVDVDPQDETRIICELIIPAEEGGWVIREIGIYDDEDDLIAVAQFPAVYKPLETEGATLDIAVRMFLVVANTAAITLEIDTSVTVATRQWVNDQLALLIPGGTTGQILHKVSNADGDYEWTDPTGVVAIVEIIEEVQTLSVSQTIVNLATCTTENAAVFVNGIRLLPTQWTATLATRITLTTPATGGEKIHVVQNEPTGETRFCRTAQNLADLTNKADARANLELLTNSTYLTALWKELNKFQYPIGEIYITRQEGNPSTLLGFGTWERYGAGRVLVGYDEADSSFNAQDKTGGAKTHTLTEAELPEHRHRMGIQAGGDLVRVDRWMDDTSSDILAGGNTNTFARSVQTSSVGGGQAHNNLQPYITVFMWKRTA
jgi:hypothetical protein